MWNAPKIVSQLFEPATFCGKVEIGLSSGWNFLEEGGMQGLRGEGRGGNQRLTAWHWLKFVFRQRIKIVPTLPSRRGRYSITHVNCRIKGKREREREKEMAEHRLVDADGHPRDEFIPDVFVNGFERVWNLENLNRWKSSFLLPRIGTQRTKEFLIIAWKYLFFLIFLIFNLFSEKRISYSLNQMHFAKTFHFAKKEKKRMTV